MRIIQEYKEKELKALNEKVTKTVTDLNAKDPILKEIKSMEATLLKLLKGSLDKDIEGVSISCVVDNTTIISPSQLSNLTSEGTKKKIDEAVAAHSAEVAKLNSKINKALDYVELFKESNPTELLTKLAALGITTGVESND